MINANLIAVAYVVSGIFFIMALRGLSSPESSRRGNIFGMLGMLIAVLATLLSVNFFIKEIFTISIVLESSVVEVLGDFFKYVIAILLLTFNNL